MAINLDKALGVHPHALALRSQRTQLLAGNLANVDTPGYQARDLDYRSTLRQVESQLAQAQLPGSAAWPALDVHPLYRIPSQISADGNTVELGAEQARFANNALDFQTSLTFLNLKIQGLAKAIEGR